MWKRVRRCGELRTLRSVGERRTDADVVTTAEEVPVRQIVGTVARCCDFDRCFRPARPELCERLRQLRRALGGRHLPTIQLVRIDDEYFVVDGHHRVALGRERGMVAMDAIVTCYCRAPRR